MADIKAIQEVNTAIEKKWNEINQLSSYIHTQLASDSNYVLSEDYDIRRAAKDKLNEELLALKGKKAQLHHEYSFTLDGYRVTTTGGATREQRPATILSIIDAQIGADRRLDISLPVHAALMREIAGRYGSEFHNNEFSVTAIFQHR